MSDINIHKSRPQYPQNVNIDHKTSLLTILTASILLNIFLTFYVVMDFTSFIKMEMTQNDAR